MNFIKVASTNVDAIAHDGAALYVRFSSGAVYRYEGVPKSMFDEMLVAESIGRFMGSVIKPAFKGVVYDVIDKEAA